MPNNRISPAQAPWAESIHSSAVTPEQPVIITGIAHHGATFDTFRDSANDSVNALSDLKKLQDPAKFNKARFSFRLYKR